MRHFFLSEFRIELAVTTQNRAEACFGRLPIKFGHVLWVRHLQVVAKASSDQNNPPFIVPVHDRAEILCSGR